VFMKASSSSNLNQKKTAKGARETFDLKELQAAMLVPMQAFAALLGPRLGALAADLDRAYS